MCTRTRQRPMSGTRGGASRVRDLEATASVNEESPGGEREVVDQNVTIGVS